MAPTVLIVDDDPTLVEMLTFVLERAGFATRGAQDGARALELLNAETIDLIVLDVMLPDMDGFEICQRIRALPNGADMPILMLSALTQVTDKLSGFESGADDYVPKPADPKEIVARVRALLGRTQRSRGMAIPVIAFVGAKGGVGTTTTAVNVALAQVAEGKRVALVELSTTSITAPWILGLEPAQTLFDQIPPKGLRLSPGALQTCTYTHASGLHYVAGHSHSMAPLRYPPGILGDAVRLLQANHDLVVLDLAACVLTRSSEALIQATAIVPIAEHDGLSTWHLKSALEWMAANKLDVKVPGFVLVDRSLGPVKQPAATVAAEVGMGVLAMIPEAATALYHANSRREPLYVADPECPASRAYAELGRRIATTPIEVPVTV
ncbi:MAG TPA: response regulator [Chloroflexi bacterium]|jgi:DNA-binding response OmpR family regulator|nr:response regulator [Chloroflexota bacterium]